MLECDGMHADMQLNYWPSATIHVHNVAVRHHSGCDRTVCMLLCAK